jgi:hypothetical protein
VQARRLMQISERESGYTERIVRHQASKGGRRPPGPVLGHFRKYPKYTVD